MQKTTVYEMAVATICARSVEKGIRTAMDGVLSSHAKVLALRAPNDSMGAWVETGGIGIGMIETRKKGLQEDLIRSLGTRREINSKKGVLDGMGLVEGGMSLHGSKTAMIPHRSLEIERATVTNL